MPIPSLFDTYIDETYQRLVQVSGSEFADGLGNPLTINTSNSGSYVTTSSFDNFTGSVVLNTQTGSFATTGSNIFTGNQTITGSLSLTSGVTGSLFGTASWAVNAVSASYALNSTSASYALSSSYSLSASLATSASYAVRADLTAADAFVWFLT